MMNITTNIKKFNVVNKKLVIIFLHALCCNCLTLCADSIKLTLAPLPAPTEWPDPYYLAVRDDHTAISTIIRENKIAIDDIAAIYFSVVITNNSDKEIEFPYPFSSSSGYNMLYFEVIKGDKIILKIQKKEKRSVPFDGQKLDKLGWRTIQANSSIVVPVVFSNIIWDNIYELREFKYDTNVMIKAIINTNGNYQLQSSPVPLSWLLAPRGNKSGASAEQLIDEQNVVR